MMTCEGRGSLKDLLRDLTPKIEKLTNALYSATEQAKSCRLFCPAPLANS